MRTNRVKVTPSVAHWHRHINGVQAPQKIADWLSNRDSLTARLMAHSEQFRVHRLSQGRAKCLADEYAEIRLQRTLQVTAREVLLCCDDVPVVYAHTILPLIANAKQWPLFASLGNRSLGTTLFNDPKVKRGALFYARLHARHPLVKRILSLDLIQSPVPHLWARRSIFTRLGSPLLVTEVFLPDIDHL
ncbi:chorismate--pyruvate lyase family protein [Undibacterium fentianense]|uniref:Probable chorismate pyruvate-lyase n=1 Tax=Undibacterium fentianense TaxID=2828728 RepID=A0A941DYX6_9BURK|nr:chorismate lyase [Undibacterium fentianense]MBR7799345.1 chorismate lyase [Undibacterium fentianense]